MRHSDKERDDETRMRTRHMAVSESVLYIPTVFDGVENKFDDLSDDTDGDGDEKHQVCLERFHKKKYGLNDISICEIYHRTGFFGSCIFSIIWYSEGAS